MKTVRVRHFDSAGAFSHTRDTVLNGDFRITPHTRIEAEPAPAAPDLGLRYDGSNGGLPTHRTAAVNQKYVNDLKDLGLTDAQISNLLRQLAYSSNPDTKGNRVGVVKIGDAQKDLQASRESIASMQRSNEALWNRQAASELAHAQRVALLR